MAGAWTQSTGSEGGVLVLGRYSYEVYMGAEKIATEMVAVKPGESVVVTADTESDPSVVNAVAGAILAHGGKPLVMVNPAPSEVAKAGEHALPVEVLAAALSHADAWVELNNKWLLYSTVWEAATKTGRVRHLCLVGMNADMLVRTVARVDNLTLRAFMNAVADLTRRASVVRITTPAGTDVTFRNRPDQPVIVESGDASVPGSHYLTGQVFWAPRLDTVEGTIVFDGSLVPPLGKVQTPVRLEVREGVIRDISGGQDAAAFRSWLEGFGNENMFRMAHICYGFNPGAKLVGDVLEDERVWGCTEWGIGYMSAEDVPPDGIPAPAHCDGICLNSSVWLDGVQVLDQGKVVHPDLVPLAQRLGKA